MVVVSLEHVENYLEFLNFQGGNELGTRKARHESGDLEVGTSRVVKQEHQGPVKIFEFSQVQSFGENLFGGKVEGISHGECAI